MNEKELAILALILNHGRYATIDKAGKDAHLVLIFNAKKRNKPIPAKVYAFLKKNNLVGPQDLSDKSEFPAILY